MQEPSNTPTQGSAIGRFFGGLWGAISWLRVFVLNLLFILILFVLISALFPAGKEPMASNTALRIAPAGYLVDQMTAQDPLAELMRQEQNVGDMETRLMDVVKAIRAAKDDSRINSIVLELDYLAGGGISKLEEVGQALTYFKGSEKPVYAIGDFYSQDQYYLAAYADEVYLNPMGGIGIMGYGSYRNYFKSALDKLAVNVHVFKVGTYKDFVEPYIRDDMSEASKEHNRQWLNQLWGSYTGRVEALRELPAGAVNDFVDNMDSYLQGVNGDGALLAKSRGFVDELLPRHQQLQAIAKKVGSNADNDGYQAVDFWDYLDDIAPQLPSEAPKIGLLVASGTILDGEQPEGSIGGDTLAQLIQQAKQADLEALILRVDSGGGSAFASEIIRQQLLDLQDDIPVIVSMGSVAASGGYWIAANSDTIWATPTTITGSIGVFGAFPTLENSLEKMGIHTDGLGTTKLAGSIRIDRPLSPMAANVIQQGIDNVYDQFLDIVAEGRDSQADEINKVAQGRVWSGEQAQTLGLVDKLGSLQDVIKDTAENLNLEDYQLVEITRELSPSELFMKELAENISAKAQSSHWSSGVFAQLSSWLAPAGEVLLELNNLNDPKGFYARCLACSAP